MENYRLRMDSLSTCAWSGLCEALIVLMQEKNEKLGTINQANYRNLALADVGASTEATLMARAVFGSTVCWCVSHACFDTLSPWRRELRWRLCCHIQIHSCGRRRLAHSGLCTSEQQSAMKQGRRVQRSVCLLLGGSDTKYSVRQAKADFLPACWVHGLAEPWTDGNGVAHPRPVCRLVVVNELHLVAVRDPPVFSQPDLRDGHRLSTAHAGHA